MRSDEIIIAYVCDSRYAAYLQVSIASVRRYNKNVRIVVLSDKMFEVEGANVVVIDPDRDKFKFRKKDRMRDGVYFKFYLPELPYDKVLYIDCDVICQRPLYPLWDEDCEFICATESHQYGEKQAKELGIERYALTGMLLCNLKAMREAGFTERCFQRLSAENPRYHDETIINLEWGDRIRFIDKKYNYCRNRTYLNPIDEADAYILHYVGKQKRDMLKLTNYRELYPLKTFLKGRSVAVVGNASSILDQGFGEEIDSHDVVIRFNKGFPSKDVGFKTHILFLATTLSREELANFRAVYTVKRSRFSGNRCDFNISPPDRVALAQEPNEFLKKTAIATRSQASTGFIAVDFCLSTDCKKIDLYGFDFFRTPTYYNDPDYVTYHNGDKERERLLELQEYGLITIH